MNYIFLLQNQALYKAYILTKRLRNLQIHYIWYKNHNSLNFKSIKTLYYIETLLIEYHKDITWLLYQVNVVQWWVHSLIYVQKFFISNLKLNRKKESTQNFLQKKKLLWIQTILYEIRILHEMSKCDKRLRNNAKLQSRIHGLSQTHSYESIGLIPRSITRTLKRFHIELIGRSKFLVLSEFKLLKYQAIASIQYLVIVVAILWMTSVLSKWFIFHPLISSYWNKSSNFMFINSSQEKEALAYLQQIEELIWLEVALISPLQNPLQNFNLTLSKQTFSVVDRYTIESVQILFNLINSIWLLILFFLLIFFGQKRLAIFNSWIQEIFYSLSDTMKAFFILLFTDLCIGFHSPHGWEIVISWAVHYFGFAENSYFISLIVSTFPVIVDTICKYWIFRHLNRISPSIVVTYHTMNE
jgi:hypothetical protein